MKTMLNFIPPISWDEIVIWFAFLSKYDSVWLSIVATSVYAGTRAWFNYRNNKSLNGLRMQFKVNEIMRYTTAHTKISRFLFLEMGNSADEVVNGARKRYWVSVIDEQHSDNMRSVKYQYQNLFVDDCYKEMVQEAWENGYVDIEVSKMPKCDLKDIYLREGVQYSRVYTIYINKKSKRVYFISVACYTYNFFKDPEINDILQRNVTEIREAYHNIYNN